MNPAMLYDFKRDVLNNVSLTRLKMICLSKRPCKVPCSVSKMDGRLTVMGFDKNTLELRYVGEDKVITYLVNLLTVAEWYSLDHNETQVFVS